MTDVRFYAAYGRQGSSARVRLFDWLDHLGIDAQVETYRDSSDNRPSAVVRDPLTTVRAEFRLMRDALAVRDSGVFISRSCSPFSNGGRERRLLAMSSHGVYDFDDAVMVPRTDPVGRIFSTARVWRKSVETADVVIAGNEFLAEAASKWNGEVHVIPSCVQPGDYLPRDRESFDREPSIVWIGSQSTERYLESIAGALSELHRRTGAKLIVISSGNRTLEGVPPEMVERRQWGPHTFALDLADGDVGIMPLDDTEWERGKCAYKLLQYGAASIPVVASPVGANIAAGRALQADLPSVESDWVSALETLLTCPPTRRFERGVAARRGVDKSYSFDAWQSRWSDLVGLGSTR